MTTATSPDAERTAQRFTAEDIQIIARFCGVEHDRTVRMAELAAFIVRLENRERGK
jgi:hypothetical protein